MTWQPEEFHGLTSDHADEMKALGLSRVQYDRHRLMVAHGDLCMTLLHLRRAQVFFKGYKPEVAACLGNIAAQLDPLVPSYVEIGRKVAR